jgi:hypothetical protein
MCVTAHMLCTSIWYTTLPALKLTTASHCETMSRHRYMQLSGKTSATMVIGMAHMSGVERNLRERHGYTPAGPACQAGGSADRNSNVNKRQLAGVA